MNRVFGGITQNSESFIPTLKYRKQDLFTPGLDASFYSALNFTESEVIDTLSGITFNWLGEAIYSPGSTGGELSRTYTTIDDKDFSSRINLGF